MRQEGHLDAEEFDRLISGHSAAIDLASSNFVLRARAHLENCQECRELLAMHEEAERQLPSLCEDGGIEPGAECPPKSELLELAAGMMAGGRREQLMEHVTKCSHCGPAFRLAVADFSDTTTPEEEGVLTSLKTGSVVWQQDLAQTFGKRTGAVSHPQQTRTTLRQAFRRPAYWAAAAGVLLIAVATGSWLSFRGPQSADELLSRAYTEQRTLEVRIPNAGYAPLRVKREAAQSNLMKPPALLEAEAIIARKLNERPSDPLWLGAKGRAELLDWNYDSAILTLKKAGEARPDTLAIKIDLASAYFERAEATGRPVDYGPAIELLGQVLEVAPQDRTALFNRAVLYEKMFMYNEALRDWESYLKADPAGEWTNEAKERLEILRKKLARNEGGTPLLMNVDEFLSNVDPINRSTWGGTDQRAESYLETAICQWLPMAFKRGEESLRAKRAVATLGQILFSSHHDRWLLDVLANEKHSETEPGFAALAKSLKANLAGDPKDGRAHAQDAESFFRRASNGPGVLRARMEELYALHRLFHGPECVQLADSLKRELERSEYTWMKIQVALEEYSCWTSQARLDRGEKLVATALKLSREANYVTLELRAIAFKAGIFTDEGNVASSWSWNRAGLEKYWNGGFPPLRAYQFYDDLEVAVEEQRELHLMLALQREAVIAISATPNRSGEAMARFRLARVASETGPVEEAVENYERAGRLFGSLPQDEASRTFEADSEVGLAEMEAKSGSLDRAEQRLEAARENVERLEAYGTRLSFYRTLAMIRSLRGDYKAAEKACLTEIRIAEKGLVSIETERDRRSWTSANSDCYRSLVSAQLKRLEVRRALDLWEWYEGAPVRPTRPALASRDVAAAANAALDQEIPSLKRETVVTYAELSDGVVAWVYDDRGVSQYRLPVTALEVEAASKAFTADCADPRSDINELQQSGQRLYRWLIEPFEPRLDSHRTLVVEGDKAIARIPFEALVDRNGHFLIESYPIAYSLGVAYRRVMRDDPITREDKALVVGDPSTSRNGATRFIPLPNARDELEYVRSQFAQGVILSGPNATVTAVLNELPEAVVFHFAGHAVASPERTGLVLFGSSASGDPAVPVLMTVELKRSTVRKCKLVVLSACSTGRDSEVAEASPENIANSLVRAGVPRVVASRWEVDSTATESLMRSFYESLLSGRSVPIALQAATAPVRNSAATKHPYFWAAWSSWSRG